LPILSSSVTAALTFTPPPPSRLTSLSLHDALPIFGTLISAFWILASNSWMQTPQGFEIINGRVVPVDWLKVIFNPSFPYRLAHIDRKSTRLNSSHVAISYAVFCLKKKNNENIYRHL